MHEAESDMWVHHAGTKIKLRRRSPAGALQCKEYAGSMQAHLFGSALVSRCLVWHASQFRPLSPFPVLCRSLPSPLGIARGRRTKKQRP